MKSKYLVRTGGLMRCCTQSLGKQMDAADYDTPEEGAIVKCEYHPGDDGMIYRDGGWEWNRPLKQYTNK